jgi:hypothetical protein
MTLIDDKKYKGSNVLSTIKSFIINVSISLAIYILIFIIGSLTMFACNVSQAKILDKNCPNTSTSENAQKEKIMINIINDNTLIKEYLTSKKIREDNIKSIFQLLTLDKPNNNKLGFCIHDNHNKNDNFGTINNSVKETINFIYGRINWYTTFLNNYIPEIFILWISPFFSFLFFAVLIFISCFYLSYTVIYNSTKNIWNSIFKISFSFKDIFNILREIIISFGLIILLIFVFLLTPIISIISFGLVLYSIFNILTQKFQKINDTNTNVESNSDYGIFKKIVDNLIYKKGYNIIIILIIYIINVFLFNRAICVILFTIIIIFYLFFYKTLNLYGVSLDTFKYIQPQK